MVTLTHELIEAGKSIAGGWTRRQLALLGVAWPPVKGWKSEKVGQRMSNENYEEFLRLKKTQDAKVRRRNGVKVGAGLFDGVE